MSSVLDETIESTETSFASLLRHESEAVLLALDIGSSGVRAALFDEKANQVTSSIRGTHRIATDNATTLLEVVIKVIDDLLALVPGNIEIQLIAISCFWHSLVGVDAQGSPTTRVLDWADTSGAQAARDLRERFSEAEIHRRTGCRFHPSYWPAKLLALKAKHPDQFSATVRWLSFSEFLTERLFGDTTISVCMASGTGIFNQSLCTWDSELLKALDIPVDRLPQISAAGITNVTLSTEFADRWPQLRSARFCPAFGDGAANSIGSGAMTRGTLVLMVGTSAAVRMVYEGPPPAKVPAALWCYRVDRQRVILGGALSDGGGLFELLREMLMLDYDFDELSDQLSQLAPDAHGLTVLPFWTGERSTNWTPNATGGILGLTARTSPIEVLRAAMESVAYRIALIVKALETVTPFSNIVASGNALHESFVWTQIISDVLGRSVMLSQTREASTRGAALLALEAAGKIQLDHQSISDCEVVFEPDFSKHAKYQAASERQQKFYDAVVSFYE